MIVITGASDGLGLQLAKVCQDAGTTVVNISRRESEFATHNVLADITDESAVKTAVEAVLAMKEPIEALVNVAGVMSFEKLGSISASEVDRIFGVNIKGAILLVSELIERLVHDGSDIINVASTNGLKPCPNDIVYGTSKWAMRGFSQNLQNELKTTNRVISFCVGGFKSDIAKKATSKELVDPENWMNPQDVAVFMKQIIDLPKSMEVSEIVINRKAAK